MGIFPYAISKNAVVEESGVIVAIFSLVTKPKKVSKYTDLPLGHVVYENTSVIIHSGLVTMVTGMDHSVTVMYFSLSQVTTLLPVRGGYGRSMPASIEKEDLKSRLYIMISFLCHTALLTTVIRLSP